MSDLIGSGRLASALFGSLLNLFNLNATNNKAYFEKVIEPGYVCLKELHSNYINRLILYKEKAMQFYHDVLGLEVVADFGANVTLTGGIALSVL